MSDEAIRALAEELVTAYHEEDGLCEVARRILALEAELGKLLVRLLATEGERDEYAEHERITHEQLGAMLGTDDSLLECARRVVAERDEARRVADLMVDAGEMLWVVLANVSGGDWTRQTCEWQEAAAKWRDVYYEATKAREWAK